MNPETEGKKPAFSILGNGPDCMFIRFFPFFILYLFQAGAEAAEPLRFTTDTFLQTHYPEVHEWLKDSYRTLGNDVEFFAAPARRGLKQSNEGVWDGEVMRIESIARYAPNLEKVPVMLVEVSLVIFQRPDRPEIMPEDLKRLKVSATLGYMIMEQLSKQHGFTLEQTDGVENALKMVDAERVDATFLSRQAGEAMAEEHGLNLVSYGHKVESLSLYHFVHKNHAGMIPELSRLLAKRLTTGPLHR